MSNCSQTRRDCKFNRLPEFWISTCGFPLILQRPLSRNRNHSQLHSQGRITIYWTFAQMWWLRRASSQVTLWPPIGISNHLGFSIWGFRRVNSWRSGRIWCRENGFIDLRRGRGLRLLSQAPSFDRGLEILALYTLLCTLRRKGVVGRSASRGFGCCHPVLLHNS